MHYIIIYIKSFCNGIGGWDQVYGQPDLKNTVFFYDFRYLGKVSQQQNSGKVWWFAKPPLTQDFKKWNLNCDTLWYSSGTLVLLYSSKLECRDPPRPPHIILGIYYSGIDLILGGLGGSRPVRRYWSNLAEMGFFAFNLRLDPLWRPNGPSERVLKPTMPSPTFDS